VLWVQTIISIIAALLSLKFIDKDETYGVEPIDEAAEPLDPTTNTKYSPLSTTDTEGSVNNTAYGTSPLREPLISSTV
jgi:hypothetical protein